MPRPLTDRQKWEKELTELLVQITGWQAELVGPALGDSVRREMLEWMIRRDKLRMTTLRKWLARG